MHRHATRRPLVFALLALLVAAPALRAADEPALDLPAADKRVAELESQVRELKAELSLVQKELIRRRALKPASAQPPATQPATAQPAPPQPVAADPPAATQPVAPPPPTVPHSADPVVELANLKKRIAELEPVANQLTARIADIRKQLAALPLVTAAAAAAADPPAQPLLYHSIVDLLNELPKELRPSGKNPWDDITRDMIAGVLTKTAQGRMFDATVTIVDIQIAKTPLFNRGNNPEWMVIYKFDRARVSYMGQTVYQQFMPTTNDDAMKYSFYTPGSFAFPSDALLVQRVKALRKGGKIHLVGRIAEVQMSEQTRYSSHGRMLLEKEVVMTTYLSDSEVYAPQLDPPRPAGAPGHAPNTPDTAPATPDAPEPSAQP